MASWATLAQLRAKMPKYLDAFHGMDQGPFEDQTPDEYFQAQLDEATQLLSLRIGGRCTVTDAAACGLDAVCVNLAAALVLQGVFRGRDEMAEQDRLTYETRARMAMDALMEKPITELIAMDGIDPVLTIADGEAILPVYIKSMDRKY